MKIITIQKIGYNAPSQANWCWFVHNLSIIDTTKKNAYTHTLLVKENFGGDTRLIKLLTEEYKCDVRQLKSVYTNTGMPKITGVAKMPIIGDKNETGAEVFEFLGLKAK